MHDTAEAGCEKGETRKRIVEDETTAKKMKLDMQGMKRTAESCIDVAQSPKRSKVEPPEGVKKVKLNKDVPGKNGEPGEEVDSRRLVAGICCDDVDSVVDSVAMYAPVERLVDDINELCHITSDRLVRTIPMILNGAISHKLTPSFRFEELMTPGDEASFIISHAIGRTYSERNGNGFYALRDIAEGTLLLVERPLVSVLDSELAQQPWASDDSGDTQGLFVALGNQQDQIVPWLSSFHPRQPSAPSELEISRYPQGETAWNIIKPCEIDRYRKICRSNSLGFYTNSEQICHSYAYQPLTGTGLFALASTFNHSCGPNVGRYSIGDVCFFRANRNVNQGDELCISYCEVDVLAEKKTIRHQSLDRDFLCACSKCSTEASCDDVEMMEIDETLYLELGMMDLAERRSSLEAMLAESLVGTNVLEKDLQNLRCSLGKCYMECGVEARKNGRDADTWYAKARDVWVDGGRAVMATCANDEGVVVFYHHVLLCDLEMQRGQCFLAEVMKVHQIAFGGDKQWYRLRYEREVQESFVSEETKDAWRLLLE